MKRVDVLLTGGLGYLGSLLTQRLTSSGYAVRVVDRLLYGEDALKKLQRDIDFEFVNCDIRDISKFQTIMENCRTFVHLAAIVGDPACDVNKDLSWDINYTATINLSQLAAKSNVDKLIFASSCSVYGNATDIVDEESRTKPLSLYAESRAQSELQLERVAHKKMCVTSMRMPTLYGPSTRMRFDLVANLFAANAATLHPITVEGGLQWRPFLHVFDAVEAFVCAMEADPSKSFEIFNVGGAHENYRIIDLAEVVKKCVPDLEIHQRSGIRDPRSYAVSFDKIQTKLGFKSKYTLEDGVNMIIQAFRRGEYSDFPNQKYSNVETLRNSNRILIPAQVS